MNRLPITTGLALMLLLAVPQLAIADADIDPDWYVSLELGKSHFIGLEDPQGPFNDIFGPGTRVTDTDTSSRIAAGYHFNPWFSIELGYVNFGKAHADGVTETSEECCGMPPVVVTVPLSESVKADGYLVEAVGNLPLNTGWSLFGRAGVMQGHTHASFGPSPDEPVETHGYESHASVTYGLGVDWMYSEHVTLRVSWDNYINLGNANGGIFRTGVFGVDVFALGLIYSFR